LAGDGLLPRTARLSCDLYGSLAATGRGHGTDRAVLLGLLGEHPDTIDPAGVAPVLRNVLASGLLRANGTHDVALDYKKDVLLHMRKSMPLHPNGMRFSAWDDAGGLLAAREFYSIGGGFIVDGSAAKADDRLSTDAREVPHPFGSMAELLEISARTGLSIPRIVLENECTWRSEDEVRAGVLKVWSVMQECITHGIANEGRLPGGLNVKRRAPEIARQLELETDSTDPLRGMDWITLYALAVNEENAAGGRVVTAPTNGAAGVIPAVLQYYRTHLPGANDSGVVRFLLTASAIGSIIKETASISGAEAGCQAEVGSACSMAAAGMACVLGGTSRQIENAAEIGMEHNLGLTCDPVKGLVQIPCIERNAIAAVKAIAAARTAMRGDGTHIVSLDTVIATMRDTGRDMRSKYKETSRGGLAVNVIEC
jgi:L-serine dehydratase